MVWWAEKTVFSGQGQKSPRKRAVSGDAGAVCNEHERGSAANPYAANPPAIAIPETLSLPDTAAIIVVADIGRTAAVITVAGSVIITGARQRAADDGAADQSTGDSSA